MRERWALGLALGFGGLVVALSAAVALFQNREASPAPGRAGVADGPRVPPDAQPDAEIAAGRLVLEAKGCLRCHSVAGVGSPRSPLDGVGSRHARASLRAFSLGEESVAEQLSKRTLEAKRRFAEMPERELEALLSYLASLD